MATPKVKQPLYVNQFNAGLYTQRSPLVTPVSSQGLQIVSRYDVLADGLNIELSNSSTLVRRAGFSRYCSTAFGSSDYPLGWASFRNIAGTIKPLVDTPTKVIAFTTSSQTTVFTKGTTDETRFQTVANTVYMVNGADTKKWDGATVSGIGIATPSTAPTLSFSAGSLSPTSGLRYVYVFKNSTTGHPSTASPVSASTGVQTSKNITVSGARSTDAQVDDIDIYRTFDGGSVYYYLATVSNPPTGTWSYTDSTADSGLNNEITAPVNHSNDPIPAGANNLLFHMGRLWTSVDNFVYFAGGGDTTNGVPEEAWPPANVFKFPGKVTAMASMSSGLLVFTASDIFIVRGTDSTSFYSQKYLSNLGVLNPNCLVQDGDLVFIYTANRQLFSISDSLDEVGFAIGDKLLTNFDPALTYITLHRNGSDSGLFISNGTTDIYRYNITKQSWSTLAQPVGGVKAIGSIAVGASDYRLMAGRAAGSGYILARDLTTYQDDSSSYAAFATVGTLVVAPLGELADVDSVLIERMPTGSDAVVSVLLNEISGTFTAVPNPINEPPMLSPATSIVSKRHYFKAATTPLPQRLRHMQVKVTFPTENFKNELLGVAVMPPM